MQAIQIAIAATGGNRRRGDRADARPGRISPAPPASPARARSRCRSISTALAGRSTSTGCAPRSVPRRARSSSTRRPTRPAGRRAEDELRAILAFARERGLWIIADEVYSRFVFDGAERAPSFYDVMDEDDRIIFVNTFSKNWAMTGWRIGWIAAPPALGDGDREPDPVFDLRRRRLHAARRGRRARGRRGLRAPAGRRARARAARSSAAALAGSNRVRFAWPDGAFYLFFTIDGIEDTAQLGLQLVDEANVGIAPGNRLRRGRRALPAPLLPAQGRGSARGDAAASQPGSEAERAVTGGSRRRDCRRRRDHARDQRRRRASSRSCSACRPAGSPAACSPWRVASLAGVNTDFRAPPDAPVFLVLGIYSGHRRHAGDARTRCRPGRRASPSSALSLVALVAGSYWWLHSRCGWARNDALLASLPGALSFVIAAAEGLKADMKKVAIAQSIRLSS